MKLNMLSPKRIKKGLAVAGLFLCLLFVTVPVYAAPEDETAAVEAVAEAETPAAAETTKAAEPETKKQKETKKEEETTVAEPETQEAKNDKSLTPVGNLTLIDDVVSAVDGNKEFLTVVSKSGNYFYLVIDRDTDGTGNVYFLNLVDEKDLYALTGEKAPAATFTQPSVSTNPLGEKETEATLVIPGEDKQAKTEELSEEELAAKKKKSLMITVGVLAAVGVGVVIYVLKSKKDKKKRSDEFDLSDFDDDDV